MCVLVIFTDPTPDVSLVVAANRDEFIHRLSAPPTELKPGVFGGKDLQAGGTWLGVNRAGLLVAVTNRRVPPRSAAAKSRGLLCLEALEKTEVSEVESLVSAGVLKDKFAGFNLVAVRAGRGVCLHYDGAVRSAKIEGGVHVVSSHRNLDDPGMPEFDVVKRSLVTWPSVEALAGQLKKILRDHSDGDSAICKHGDGYGTVSSSLVVLRRDGGITYHHSSGPPCRGEFRDYTSAAAHVLGPSLHA